MSASKDMEVRMEHTFMAKNEADRDYQEMTFGFDRAVCRSDARKIVRDQEGLMVKR